MACNPVVLSYLMLTETEIRLYAAKEAFPEEVLAALAADGFSVAFGSCIHERFHFPGMSPRQIIVTIKPIIKM